MITKDGKTIASYVDNVNVYPDTIALFTVAPVIPPTPTVVPPTPTPTVVPPTPRIPSLLGWNYRGCYTDIVAARSLGVTMQVPGGGAAMTIETCILACDAAGYNIAGVEWSQECC
jgi:glucan 1,3-beta-glucosidase